MGWPLEQCDDATLAGKDLGRIAQGRIDPASQATPASCSLTVIQDRQQRGFGLSPQGFDEFEVATGNRIYDQEFLRVVHPYLLQVRRRPALSPSDVRNQPRGSGQSGVQCLRIGAGQIPQRQGLRE